MKIQNFRILSFSFFFLVNGISNAQLLDNIVKKVQDISGKTKELSFDRTAAISTAIKDTLYGIKLFDEDLFIPEMADEIGNNNLTPGYYRSTIRSYCLKAGVYGPTKGDGYQIARLKGRKAKLVHAILKKSTDHPKISQSDVQTLIWGIEAGTKFSKYPLNFQLRVKPLLTKKDMLFMQINFDKIKNKVIPDKVQSLLDTYGSLRSKMQSAQMKYDELEEIAVKNGIPPLGIGSKEIHKGIWSYIGNGFFMRSYPKVYSTTDIELYRPAKLDITKDHKKRITHIANAQYLMKIFYDDSQGGNVFDYGHTQVPVWRINKLHLKGPEKDQDTILDVDTWIFRGAITNLEHSIHNDTKDNRTITNSQEKGGPSPVEITFKKLVKKDKKKKQPTWDDVYNRYKKLKEWYKKFKEYEGYAKEIDEIDEIKPIEDYLNEDYANKRIYEGLKTVSNPTDFKGRSTWMRQHFKMLSDVYANVICILSGGCSDNNANDPDLSSYVGQPGNTSLQRIGHSRLKR